MDVKTKVVAKKTNQVKLRKYNNSREVKGYKIMMQLAAIHF